ncbi:MAG: sugar ABC transporter permease [Ruminococcaceae bacterium]|nr:sugar ABC transporter permease [Oscillospiraceae bacterium]
MTLEWRSTISLGFLTLPAIVWFIVFCYIPMFGIIIAFKDFDYAKGIFGSDWCGFDNFVYLFKSNDAFRILRNTILYNFSFIVIGTIAAIAMALMLDSIKSKAFIKFTQTTIFLPYFISWVVVAFVTQQMFALNNGAMNSLIEFFGGEKVLWYTNTKAWPIILIIANLWKQIGFNTIVYYGSILGIDSSLYEAARIDGASGRQCITKITLPLLKPTIVILFIMSIGSILRADFGLFYYLPNNQGPLYPVTDVIDTYIYRALKVSGDLTGSSAASFVQSVVGLILVLITNTITKKLDPENALF